MSLIETPSAFNLASLVQDAIDVDNFGVGFDDLESNLLPTPPPLTEKPERFKRPRTPPTLPSTTSLIASNASSHRNKKRTLKRRKKVNEEGHIAKPRTIFEHVQLADAVDAAVQLQALPVANGGYSARFLVGNQFDLRKEYTLAELDDLGFTILGWDGR